MFANNIHALIQCIMRSLYRTFSTRIHCLFRARRWEAIYGMRLLANSRACFWVWRHTSLCSLCLHHGFCLAHSNAFQPYSCRSLCIWPLPSGYSCRAVYKCSARTHTPPGCDKYTECGIRFQSDSSVFKNERNIDQFAIISYDRDHIA